jgi:uncharacterized membrane protein
LKFFLFIIILFISFSLFGANKEKKSLDKVDSHNAIFNLKHNDFNSEQILLARRSGGRSGFRSFSSRRSSYSRGYGGSSSRHNRSYRGGGGGFFFFLGDGSISGFIIMLLVFFLFSYFRNRGD